MKKILENKILGIPMVYAIIVFIILFIGILLGSFLDLDICAALIYKNATAKEVGTQFATYGLILPYCLYPAAGMCFFKALKKKGKNYTLLAWALLVISFFLAVYYSDNYSGSKLRGVLGNFTGVWFVSILIWILIYSWVPVVCYFIIDDSHPECLIAVATTILLAGIASDCMNVWLKQLSSRPRYNYLLTQEAKDLGITFKNWWEWNPYAAGSNDNFKSWPSGNLTIAMLTCTLPLFITNVKKSNKTKVYIALAFSCAFVILYGYNRIHMGKHYLTDVCFGILFTYLIFILVDQGFKLSLSREAKK